VVKDLVYLMAERVDDMDWRFGVQSIRYPGFGICWGELGRQISDELNSPIWRDR